MRMWIDCEWNSYGGDLISIALVTESDEIFYEELACNNPHPWVAINVIPKLFQQKITYKDLQLKLHKFLNKFDAVHVIADWPEDIERFCKLLIVEAGLRIDTPPLTMEIVRIDSKSDNPHNALYDAKTLKREYYGNVIATRTTS